MAYVSCDTEEMMQKIRALHRRYIHGFGMPRVVFTSYVTAAETAETIFEKERRRRKHIRLARSGADVGHVFCPTFVLVKNFIRGTGSELIREHFNADFFHRILDEANYSCTGEGILAYTTEEKGMLASYRDGESFLSRRMFMRLLHHLEVNFFSLFSLRFLILVTSTERLFFRLWDPLGS